MFYLVNDINTKNVIEF